MSGLENLRLRMNYHGGARQQSRMNEDKLVALKRALLYSYQAATAVLADGREFRCLINPDKLKKDYDDKIISIPFEDICLNKERVSKTTEGLESIDLKTGDIFEWKDNGSYWLVYLQRLEETAYFRAEIRRCRYEIDINGNKYKVYVRGPVEEVIDWKNKHGITWNELNYTLVMTLTNNEETDAYFHRFTKIKFRGKNWEVQAIDNISTEGVIDVYLKEYYSNTIQEEVDKENEENMPEVIEPEEGTPQIKGENQVYPYDSKEFVVENATGGTWVVDSNKVNIVAQTDSTVKVNVVTGKSGKFNLIYRVAGADDIVFPVTILSL